MGHVSVLLPGGSVSTFSTPLHPQLERQINSGTLRVLSAAPPPGLVEGDTVESVARSAVAATDSMCSCANPRPGDGVVHRVGAPCFTPGNAPAVVPPQPDATDDGALMWTQPLAAGEAQAMVDRADELPVPRGNASHAEWVRYAESQGLDTETATGMRRDELRARFDTTDLDED